MHENPIAARSNQIINNENEAYRQNWFAAIYYVCSYGKKKKKKRKNNSQWRNWHNAKTHSVFFVPIVIRYREVHNWIRFYLLLASMWGAKLKHINVRIIRITNHSQIIVWIKWITHVLFYLYIVFLLLQPWVDALQLLIEKINRGKYKLFVSQAHTTPSQNTFDFVFSPSSLQFANQPLDMLGPYIWMLNAIRWLHTGPNIVMQTCVSDNGGYR